MCHASTAPRHGRESQARPLLPSDSSDSTPTISQHNVAHLVGHVTTQFVPRLGNLLDCFTRRCSAEMAERIELVFGAEADVGLSYIAGIRTVLDENM